MNEFKFGDRVRHPKYGECMVVTQWYDADTDEPNWAAIISELHGECEVRNEELELIPQSAWISVNDALPEKDGMYLTYIKSAEYAGIDLTSFTDGKFRENLALNEVVTHWQPLPEPPKGE